MFIIECESVYMYVNAFEGIGQCIYDKIIGAEWTHDSVISLQLECNSKSKTYQD